MSHHRRDDDEEPQPEPEPEPEEAEDMEGDRGGRKRRRYQFIDDVAEEEYDGDFGGGGGCRAKRRSTAEFFYDIAAVASDDEEEIEDGDDDFIVEPVADLQDGDDCRRNHRLPFLSREDEQEDVEALEKSIHARYARSNHTEYDEETTDVEQQALLPSVRDPKLWMVKCAIGDEREAAVCLMQKSLDKGSELQIRSVIALDHLKNYIYVEADKEAHVKQACNGLRVIYTNTKITLVPIKEMTDVLSMESKAFDLSRDTWVRMKIGTYKGDLAQVVDVDNVRQRVTVKLIPRIDLQAVANKLKTLAVNEKELCKYFKPGNHVKVVSGASEGAAGMVVRVEGHVVIILSDMTKEHIRVFADNVVESSEVTTGVTRIGDYELHDLVMLDNMSFGVIIRVETEAFQILKGVPERPEVALIRLRDIKSKLERKNFAQDQSKNRVSVKDVVSILEGPYRGKQGPVEHIFRGILFIYDRHHLGHSGFICAKSQSCIVVGGSHMTGDRNGGSWASRYAHLQSPACVPQSPGRFPRGPPVECIGRHGGGRGHDPLVGTTVKVHQGPFKGYQGCVVDVQGLSVRV